MKIKTRCGHCGKVYNMSADFIGKTAQCKQCHNNFVMTPMPEGPPPAQAAQQQAPARPPQQPPYTAPAAAPIEQPFQQQFSAPQPPFQAPHQAPMAMQPPAFAAQPGGGMPGQAPFSAPQPPMQAGRQLSPQGLPNPYSAPQPPNPFVNPAVQGGGSYSGFQANQAVPQAAAQPAGIDPSLQTIVCPKCRFTAGIPPVTGKMRLRCQECGHVFPVKPDPKFKKLIKNATKGKVKSGGGKKLSTPILALLVVIFLLVAILFVGPTVLPG